MNHILDRLMGRNRPKSASIAKERLQIIVAHERGQGDNRGKPDFLPALQAELIEVIRKYVHIEQDQVQIAVDDDGGRSVLELNVMLDAPR